MGKFIVKIRDYYLEWSTISDAPSTFGMGYIDFLHYYREKHGYAGMEELAGRLERVSKYGTSSLDRETPEDVILLNRAGPSESKLTLDEIYRAYCLRESIDGWRP